MSQEMAQHVLSAIVDQIPDKHLINLHTLIEQRLGWHSLYTIDANMWCFTAEIEERVEETLTEIGKFSFENKEHWVDVCRAEWSRRFSDPQTPTYDYGECIGNYTCQDIQEDVKDAFVASDDVHDLMRDTILKHYGVQPDGL